jgi:proteasome lid subunit RPN8/RPN11
MNPFSLRKKLRNHQSNDTVPLLASPQPEPESLYTRTGQQAIGYGEEIIHALLRNLREGEIADLDALWELFPFYVNVVATAKVAIGKTPAQPISPPKRAEPFVSEYLVSSMFLAQCHAYLTSQKGFERLHLVTGQKVGDNRRTLDYMSKVALSEQSAVGAVADPLALKQALMEMDEWGHALYALYHSHPGHGALATRPSSIDLATHERYERRYPLIGCIFVEDGHLRFFSATTPFSISICGKGVIPINEDEHIFKIQNPRAARFLSYDTLAGS